jgi:RNAse (barnase) inhibitor barstar
LSARSGHISAANASPFHFVLFQTLTSRRSCFVGRFVRESNYSSKRTPLSRRRLTQTLDNFFSMNSTVRINGDEIQDWDTFHNVFAETFGFPGFYGRNMDAWIDCMSYLAEPEAEMTTIHTTDGGVVTLVVENADSLKERCPEQYSALVECAGFVNWRLTERNEPAVLALAFYA